MDTMNKVNIKVSGKVEVPVEKTWELWTNPRHILHWNSAQDDWYTTYAENDLREGGRFISRMEAKNGSEGFDFTGTYSRFESYKLIEYKMDDGRKAEVHFIAEGNATVIEEIFEPENTNPEDMQYSGWQAILNNFKKYAEAYRDGDILHFEVLIDAPADKVYEIMTDPVSYSEWTSEFNPTSSFDGSWDKRSKILFLGEDPQSPGNTGGMVGHIRENVPGRFISIEHRGIFKNGREILSGPEVERWTGAMENYTFTENDGQTILSIDVDSDKEFKSYFEETWPKALQKLKHICEVTKGL